MADLDYMFDVLQRSLATSSEGWIGFGLTEPGCMGCELEQCRPICWVVSASYISLRAPFDAPLLYA